VLVIDVGTDRPHALLADKMADDLRALRGDRPVRAAAAERDRLHAAGANLVVLASDHGDPWITALAGGLDLRISGDGLSFAGTHLAGEDASAAVLLPRDGETDRWVLLLVGTGPAALRRLDGAIRSDIAAPVLALDDEGERLAELTRRDGRWTVPPGHPYRAEEVVEQFESWRRRSRARVSRWDLTVTPDPDSRLLEVEARVSVDRRRRGGAELWFQLNPRAELGGCREDGRCLVHDARDGRLLVRWVAGEPGEAETLSYRLPLEGRIGAWYLGPERGYVLPEANWVPRIRGGPDEPHRATAPHQIHLNLRAHQVHVGADARGHRRVDQAAAPHLVWGEYREEEAAAGALYLAPGAPPEVVERGRELMSVFDGDLPGSESPLHSLVAADRPVPWFGDGLLLVTPELLDPRPVDGVDRWLLARVRAEAAVRDAPPTGRAVRVEGRVEPDAPNTTVRLWRLRGSWWQLEDEGPLGTAGEFTLVARGTASRMVTADAPGQLPAAVRLAIAGSAEPLELELEPVIGGSMVCFRCGPDQQPERFPLRALEAGRLGVTLALGDLHREYGSFPYAFELSGDSGRTALVLDPRRPPEQFPSFLSPEEFHSEIVEFQLPAGGVRTWVEASGTLLLREGWIEGAEAVSPPPR